MTKVNERMKYWSSAAHHRADASRQFSRPMGRRTRAVVGVSELFTRSARAAPPESCARSPVPTARRDGCPAKIR